MSREQRRSNRRAQPQTRGSGPPSRRTPVKAAGAEGFPWTPVAVVVGVIAIALLIGYLVFQSATAEDSGLSADEIAERDDDPNMPGVFFPSQGRGHFSYGFSADREQKPFCEGVPHSGDTSAGATPAAGDTPAAATAPAATSTPAATTAAGTPASGTTAAATPTVPVKCYSSNPPSSGEHLGVARNVDVGNGRINIPADPDVYPEDIIVPREAIPHTLEHAGIFVGYHCAEGDQACRDVVDQLADLVNNRIDNHDDRVVMSNDPDLPVGEIGVAGWTRVLRFPYADYDENEVERFIVVHACRFDPEGFCG
jgi:hypothetical protein